MGHTTKLIAAMAVCLAGCASYNGAGLIPGKSTTVENVTHVVPNTWTKKEVRELFGPPFMVSTLPRLEREVWEYQLLEVDFKWKLWVQFSPDGVVREVLKMRHPHMDPPSASGKD